MLLSSAFSWINKAVEPKRYDQLMVGIGHVFFLLLMVMSIVYYKERLLSFDAANYTFQLIYFQDFYIGHDRWISAPTQILPLLAIKAGASLKTILMTYSVSFILFYYLIFNAIVYLVRQPKVGLFLALSLCLSMRYKFFGPVGEVILSIGLLALLLAWANRDRSQFPRLPRWGSLVIGLALMGLVVFAGHPFAAIAAFTILGFDLIQQKRWKDRESWAMIALGVLGYGRKYLDLQGDGSYEAGQMDNLQESLHMLTHFQTYYIFDRIRWFFETEYAFPFVVFLAAVGWLFWKRKWLLGLFIIASHVLLLAAIMVAYAYLNDPIYILLDGYLAHLGMIWSLPIIFVIVQQQRIWSLLLVVVLLGFGLDRIHHKRLFFQERMAILQNMLDEYTTDENRKVLAHIDYFDWNKLWLPWAVSIETLMMSSLEDPDQAATIYYKQHRKDEEDYLNNPHFFFSLHYDPFIFEMDSLPKHLFRLKEGYYQSIPLPK
ncbi:MAG: hypothetical protein R2828_25275 [Saprospiraceae bacterium]